LPALKWERQVGRSDPRLPRIQNGRYGTSCEKAYADASVALLALAAPVSTTLCNWFNLGR